MNKMNTPMEFHKNSNSAFLKGLAAISMTIFASFYLVKLWYLIAQNQVPNTTVTDLAVTHEHLYGTAVADYDELAKRGIITDVIGFFTDAANSFLTTFANVAGYWGKRACDYLPMAMLFGIPAIATDAVACIGLSLASLVLTAIALIVGTVGQIIVGLGSDSSSSSSSSHATLPEGITMLGAARRSLQAREVLQHGQLDSFISSSLPGFTPSEEINRSVQESLNNGKLLILPTVLFAGVIGDSQGGSEQAVWGIEHADHFSVTFTEPGGKDAALAGLSKSVPQGGEALWHSYSVKGADVSKAADIFTRRTSILSGGLASIQGALNLITETAGSGSPLSAAAEGVCLAAGGTSGTVLGQLYTNSYGSVDSRCLNPAGWSA
ncbi:HCL569Wp [Eremothecium sinecaudum]|uniref:HCL569Wp n=1 Tax=Eremothecium sinecaudum TaxID=45286 RepID=A0A109UYP3_9SACH|nr:HCL569Wp [Eremothecium sinecaudum]AMD19582.1 HCL569Wp [Eremothecium sinecaudum]